MWVKNHDQRNRVPARAWVCAAALCGFPLTTVHAAEATADQFAGFMQRVTGANSVTVGVGGSGQLVITKPSAQLGGTSGWSSAPNFGSGSTSTGVRLGMTGDATIAGKKVPLTVSTPISKAALGDGMGILFRSAARLSGLVGIAVLLADFAPMLQQAGIPLNPDPATSVDKPFLHPEDEPQCTSTAQAWTNPTAWCVSAYGAGITGVRSNVVASGGMCTYRVTCSWSGGSVQSGVFYATLVSVIGSMRPANWDVVRPKFEAMNPMPSDIVQRQIDWARRQAGKNGVEPWSLQTGTSTVTAPPALAPETTTKTTTRTEPSPQGGTRTVTETTTATTTRPVSVTGDSVKVTPTTETTTETTKTEPDGTTTTETDSETETSESDKDPATDDDPGLLCKVFPKILACQEMDTPSEEIPKQEREVTYAPVDLGLGAGSCPPDVPLAVAGRSYALSYAPACDFASTWMRPVVLALALLGAFFIIAPGRSN